MYLYKEFIKELNASKSDYIEDFSDLYIAEISNKLNVKYIKKLGAGTYGIAYLVSNNKVIKVTTDRLEAKNAKNLIGKNLNHFLNYYNVFELTLDGMKSPNISKLEPVYFILMDYIKPLNDYQKNLFKNLTEDFFDRFLDNDRFREVVKYEFRATYRYGDMSEIDMLDFFIPFINQRKSILKEGFELGIDFSDAHIDNLGIKRNGDLVYFDIGYYDEVYVDPDVEVDIKKYDLTNYYKIIKKMILDKYEPDVVIELNDLINDISKLLNINKVNSYKFLRDEILAYHSKYGYQSPISFISKDKNSEWGDNNILDHEIRRGLRYNDIAVIYNSYYKKDKIEI